MLPLLLIIALGFCFGSKLLYAESNNIFQNHEIGKIKNFQENYDEIFEIVAIKMGLEINKTIPKPIILTDAQITTQMFNSNLGWEVENIFPYYFFDKNTIVIPESCKLDSLVHELVHYFQVMYQNENLDFDCGPYIDNLEMEAVVMQRWFKSVYLDPHKANYGIAVKTSHQVVTSP
jgi:hypothetical protein